MACISNGWEISRLFIQSELGRSIERLACLKVILFCGFGLDLMLNMNDY